MIKVTLEGKLEKTLFLNPHQIEYIEVDEARTSLVMLSGKRYVVREDYQTIYKRIVLYRRRIGCFKNEE